jgi:hypothetical protein
MRSRVMVPAASLDNVSATLAEKLETPAFMGSGQGETDGGDKLVGREIHGHDRLHEFGDRHHASRAGRADHHLGVEGDGHQRILRSRIGVDEAAPQGTPLADRVIADTTRGVGKQGTRAGDLRVGRDPVMPGECTDFHRGLADAHIIKLQQVVDIDHMPRTG